MKSQVGLTHAQIMEIQIQLIALHLNDKQPLERITRL
jgi:hypothetical protein